MAGEKSTPTSGANAGDLNPATIADTDDSIHATKTHLRRALFDLAFKLRGSRTAPEQPGSRRWQGPFRPRSLPLTTPSVPVPFTAVRITDGFWKIKQDINREITVPFALQQCENSGRLKNFDLAAEVMRRRAAGEKDFQIKPPTQYPFDDTDVYKSIEAAVLCPQHGAGRRTGEKDGRMDPARRRRPGAGRLSLYLSHHAARHAQRRLGGKRALGERSRNSHELYDAGHLYEAGVAYYMATGKRSLLDVCQKNAELLWHVFGDGKWRLAPGHEIVEMGLVKLYRVTGDAALAATRENLSR